jgi:prepilin-type N-terminal cleavage/methylation domain-containing protein
MLLWRVRKSNSGFTLVEMLAVVIIIGVIAAIAAPNLLGWFNNNRVNEAMRQVEGALKEAQKQAIRTGKRCTIEITTNAISNYGTDGCLLSNRNLNDLIQLDSNLAILTFSGKGNITIDGAGNPRPAFVVSMRDGNGTNFKKCVVVQNFLGAIRTGKYIGSVPLDSESSKSCETPN